MAAIIIAGRIHVAAADRDRYVAAHQDIVTAARAHPGCLDVAISPDPIDPTRVNMIEHWASHDVLDEFRAIAPPPAARFEVRSMAVEKHEIARSGPPFD
jgi:quinol monooxygenase YgiN